MSGYINTVSDLVEFYRKRGPLYELAVQTGEFAKEAGSYLTSVPGFWKPIYGAIAWQQYNLEANIFGVLPKTPWRRTGWRMVEELAWGNTFTGGIGEDDELPTAQRMKIKEVYHKPKTVVHVFEMSDIQRLLASSGYDDVYGDLAQIRTMAQQEHGHQLNKALGRPITDTIGANDPTPLDKVVSSYSESTITGVGNNADVYGIDRHTAASNYDSQVIHNNGTTQALGYDQLVELLQTTRKKGANPAGQFWLTSYEVYSKMLGLFTNFVRYNDVGETKITVGVNGINTPSGIRAGFEVATVLGLPVIVSKDVTVDGNNGRLYLLDASNPEGHDYPRMSLMTLVPTSYYEADNPILLNKFAVKGAYRTVFELNCRRLNVQGKIRDIDIA